MTPTLQVFTFDVGVTTHDLLKRGVTVHHYRRVDVAAEDHTEAAVIACQMAGIAQDFYVTDCLVRI
jgi:hypothetical protein